MPQAPLKLLNGFMVIQRAASPWFGAAHQQKHRGGCLAMLAIGGWDLVMGISGWDLLVMGISGWDLVVVAGVGRCHRAYQPSQSSSYVMVFGSKKKSSRSEYQFAFVLSSLFFFHCSQKSFCRQPRDHHMLFAPNLLVLPCRTSRAPARDVPGAFNLQNCLPRRIAVNIGECRSGGESCPPAVLVIHRSPSRWGNEEKLLGLEFCSLAARS